MSLWICSCLLILTATLTEQQQCGVANLPAFGDRSRNDTVGYLGRPPNDRLQAIVPAYTFNCTGRVTEWRACVDPGGRGERYYIQFQVWRPTGVLGCYGLVGYNAPPPPLFSVNGVINADQLLRPLDHCILLLVSEGEQIQFQSGDVIGYYVDQFTDSGDDHDDGGVQVISDQNVAVYHRIDVPLSELQTQHAIPALVPDPSSCGFEVSGSKNTLFQLTSSISGAPIISLSLTAVVTSGVQSNGVQLATATVPSVKPTSTYSTTPPLPFGVHSSSSVYVIGSVSDAGCSGRCNEGPTGASNSLAVGVGVAGAVLVLITAAVITITVLVCLRRRSKAPDLVDNAISGTGEETVYESLESEGDAHYMYTNEAYNGVQEVTDVSLSMNPAYQSVQYQSGCDGFIYDYPRPD